MLYLNMQVLLDTYIVENILQLVSHEIIENLSWIHFLINDKNCHLIKWTDTMGFPTI